VGASRVIRRTEEGWAGVPPRRYKDDDAPFFGVIRHTLLRDEPPGTELTFELRCFEVAPGGYTTLERHEHPHAVMVLGGRGTVRLGDTIEPISPFDVVYVAPSETHRFEADDEEGLAFLCVVDRDRDRPEPVSEGGGG
jgi:quercetin dioxygenase-like cupin family protein